MLRHIYKLTNGVLYEQVNNCPFYKILYYFPRSKKALSSSYFLLFIEHS